MAERVVTKVGYIYRTRQTARGPRYFQLVAIDLLDLNSDVIAVFGSSADYTGQSESLAGAEVEFYTHTTVSQGVREGLWQKVGKGRVGIDIARLLFKSYHGMDEAEAAAYVGPEAQPPVPYPNWTVWSPDDREERYIPEDEGLAIRAERGGVFPAGDVLYRIEHGHSEFRSDWPEGA